jgi:hypothetical protein
MYIPQWNNLSADKWIGDLESKILRMAMEKIWLVLEPEVYM